MIILITKIKIKNLFNLINEFKSINKIFLINSPENEASIFNYDITKPTMIPIRLVDVSRIKNELGWEAKHDLKTGLEKTIEWYKNNK